MELSTIYRPWQEGVGEGQKTWRKKPFQGTNHMVCPLHVRATAIFIAGQYLFTSLFHHAPAEAANAIKLSFVCLNRLNSHYFGDMPLDPDRVDK